MPGDCAGFVQLWIGGVLGFTYASCFLFTFSFAATGAGEGGGDTDFGAAICSSSIISISVDWLVGDSGLIGGMIVVSSPNRFTSSNMSQPTISTSES